VNDFGFQDRDDIPGVKCALKRGWGKMCFETCLRERVWGKMCFETCLRERVWGVLVFRSQSAKSERRQTG